MTRFILCGIALSVAWGVLSAEQQAKAVVKAMDSAANPAYAAEAMGAWKGTYTGDPPVNENPPGMDNGGTGFLPWNFDYGGHADLPPYNNLNHFIDGIDFPTTAFNNLGGPAFGLGNADQGYAAYLTATATRPFSAPMAVGDVFSVEFDTPAEYVDLSPDDFGAAGYPFAFISFIGTDDGLPETKDETLVLGAGSSSEFGDFPWEYTDATGKGDFGVAAGVGSMAPTATSDGSTLSLEILSPTTGRVIFDGAQLNLQFKLGLPRGVRFTLFDNDADAVSETDLNPTGEHGFYFDNLKIEGPGGGVPGDFDGDGDVDSTDFNHPTLGFKARFGADLDGEDFLTWQRNFGTPAAVAAAGAVPEPSAIALAACWTLVAGGAFRGRVRRIHSVQSTIR